MSDFGKIGGVRFKDGKMLDPGVRSGSVHSDATDGTTIGLNTSSKLEVKDASITAAKMAQGAGYWRTGTLTASDAAAGIFSIENTDASNDLVVTRLVIGVMTASSGACTADFGTAATEVSSDNLLDGINLNAAGYYDTNQSGDHGTNGTSIARIPASGYLTGSKSTGHTSGLVGWFLVHLIEQPS